MDFILLYRWQYMYTSACYIVCFPQLLAKEQEADEKSHHLKTATSEIESLKTEVSRLRRYEDELNNVQVSRLVEKFYLLKFIFN